MSYVDDFFILYLKDAADSLYAAFTRELTRRWKVEDEGRGHGPAQHRDIAPRHLYHAPSNGIHHQACERVISEWNPRENTTEPHRISANWSYTGEVVLPANPALVNKFRKLVGASLLTAHGTYRTGTVPYGTVQT